MATDWPDYELLDFGDGRRLERFGELTLDRPCPAAGEPKAEPSLWKDAAARYDGARATDGAWRPRKAPGAACRVPLKLGEFTLGVTPSPAGQVGLFPEQLASWRWIAERTARLAATRPDDPPRVLNLFGYTGGSTLAAAVAGAAVTHVDASKPSVALARENAAASGLGDAPIRWLVEDAVRYCEREVKRDSRYDAVVLDPPSYGHGPKGEEWRLERDLPKLLDVCATLVDRTPQFFLATCHTPGRRPGGAVSVPERRDRRPLRSAPGERPPVAEDRRRPPPRKRRLRPLAGVGCDAAERRGESIYSVVDRHAQAPLAGRDFRRAVMHGVPVSGMPVSFEEHQPAEGSDFGRALSGVLVLGGRTEVRRHQANVDVVAVELRARLRSRDFDPQSRLR